MAIQQKSQPLNRSPSKTKNPRFSHTANAKYGMGDNYGTGIKAKLGKVRDDTVGMVKLSKKKLGTPPKSVV
jgi:hypothetical protein